MPYGARSPLRDRIEVELVEADVEIGFNLVDLAEQEWRCGHALMVARVLHDADDVLHDINERLSRLGSADRECFGPLVTALRRELETAKSRHAGAV